MQQLFRDRLREHSGRPLSSFLFKIIADWLVTVFQERYSAMRIPSIPVFRSLMLLGVLLDLALLFFRFSHDVFHGDAQTSFAVLLMYALIVPCGQPPAPGRSTPAPHRAPRGHPPWALISGAIMFVNTTYGNYFRYGNYLRFSDAVTKGFAVIGLCAVFVLWLAAGYRSARTGGPAALAGSWAGIVAVLFKVTFAYLLLLTPGPDPNFVATWHIFKATGGPSLGVHAWMIQQTLSAGGFHLLIGPIFGALLGAALRP